MKTIAIDPGYDRLGIAIFLGETLVTSECFIPQKTDHEYRLRQVGEKIREYINLHAPKFLAIETLFFSTNQKTALKVAEVRGVILYEAAQNNLVVFEYHPNEIKLAVTGHGASDKKQVTSMVQLLTKKIDATYDDEYDAIAVGLTHNALFAHKEREKKG